MSKFVPLVRGDLFFRRRNHGVRMFAKKDVAHPLGGEETGRGAFDAQFFYFLAALAFELILGEGSIAREIGQHRENAFGKLREAADRNGACVGSRTCSRISAHAAQIFFNLAARTRCRSRANYFCGDFCEPGRTVSDGSVPAAKEKLARNFREGVGFGEDDLQAIRERHNAALRPRDRALGTKRRCGAGRLQCDGCFGRRHREPPFECAVSAATGVRATMARLRGTKYLCATACACSGVTARNPSSTVLMRFGSPSNKVKHAR